MKLPEDKNERTKILALILVGVVAVLYGVVAGIIKPISRKKMAVQEEIAVTSDNIARAADKIRLIDQMQINQRRALHEINTITQEHILHPRLGNYLLDASEIVQLAADELEIAVESIDEIGIMQLPPISPQLKDNVFKSYGIRARLECGYGRLADLIASLENDNPYACVSEINIAGNPKDPENHLISINVQWPIWADEEAALEINEQLREMKGTEEQSNREQKPEDKT